jgi:hypothetical protein
MAEQRFSVPSASTKTAAIQRTSPASEASNQTRARQSNPGSRAAVLSQAGAPLSWTSERADTLTCIDPASQGADCGLMLV